jgi:hypothetical protein
MNTLESIGTQRSIGILCSFQAGGKICNSLFREVIVPFASHVSESVQGQRQHIQGGPHAANQHDRDIFAHEG